MSWSVRRTGSGLVAGAVQYRLTHTSRQEARGETLALYFLRLIVTLGLIALVRFRDGFIEHAHGVAGTLMILAPSSPPSSAPHTSPGQRKSRSHRIGIVISGSTGVIAVVMLVTLIAVVTMHLARPYWIGDLWIIVLETALILEFAAYWVVQSIELWDTPDPRDRLPEDARSGLPEGGRSVPEGTERRAGPSKERRAAASVVRAFA